MKKQTRQTSLTELLAIIRQLKEKIAEQAERIAEQDKRIAQLERKLARARKNSSTSSKPPSSDIVKPPSKNKTNGEKKRKIGGQPGHPKHERPTFTVEEVDHFHPYTLDLCPNCSGKLHLTDLPPRVIQQMELVEKPVHIHEHQGLAYLCEDCEEVHYGPLPPEVEAGGLVGPRLTALVAYLKGFSHASFSTIRKFLRDAGKVTISRGQLAKIIRKVTSALEGPYNELLEQLPFEERVNVDETGHRENKERFWTWCFRAESYVLFKIDKLRSSKVLLEVLGKEFEGALGCDYFSAYRKYMKDCDILVQFCLAHLIRDLKYLTTLPDKDTVIYGENLLGAMREMFGIIHRRDQMGKRAFAQALEESRKTIIILATYCVPSSREAQNLANRFLNHGDAYFRFITTPGLEPTNNLAEQAIRFVVIDRLITQGTRSEKGRDWCERIWTVLATCTVQGRSAFNYLCEAVQALFTNQPAPPLLLNTS